MKKRYSVLVRMRKGDRREVAYYYATSAKQAATLARQNYQDNTVKQVKVYDKDAKLLLVV